MLTMGKRKLNNLKNRYTSVLFLPECPKRKYEGGLRTKDYFKKSYTNKPLVTIVTVTYNSARFLEKTIKSVLNQTYDNIEYIIIDGCSNDGTTDIIKKYEDRIDYWVSERDGGIYDAMNKGISLSKGEVIGLINSDDWCNETSIENVMSIFINNTTVDVVHGALAKCDIDENIVKIIHKRGSYFSFSEKPPFSHPTVFVKSDVYKKIGLFNLNYKTAADYDFMLKVLKNKSLKIKYIDIVITNFRLVGATSNNWLPPVKQLYPLLRANNFNFFIITIAILYRIARNLLAKLVK
jgi:glycosyltransferase involved in cell wall biosynthesis